MVEQHSRVVIGGAPRAGKTTFSGQFANARHTDDLIPLGWSEASDEAALWLQEPGPWVVEGVTAVRALRKALSVSDGRPCDLLVWLRLPWVPLTQAQAGMVVQGERVLDEIEPELRARGVVIVQG